eukprot:TRINITY_DN10662_c0_g2_i1.p2 TRINITY_DN10662_c0_g2~~TRINITY_DN10662_c0_g2_i1.p2  ORF type:complete len:114 (+),score=6.14 TRINITY_DN10662_c0_g2_i1:375-716(+)
MQLCREGSTVVFFSMGFWLQVEPLLISDFWLLLVLFNFSSKVKASFLESQIKKSSNRSKIVDTTYARPSSTFRERTSSQAKLSSSKYLPYKMTKSIHNVSSHVRKHTTRVDPL